MAPRWTPNAHAPIGPSESIGRRLFDEPLLAGAEDQGVYAGLRLDHFQNPAGDREYSLDRLGSSGIDGRVVTYLIERCRRHANSFREPKTFHGWTTLTARKLRQPPKGKPIDLCPSPIEHEAEELDRNLYHAHALRPEEEEDYGYALHLKHIFGTFGAVHPAPAARGAPVEKLQAPAEMPMRMIADMGWATKLKGWGRLCLHLLGFRS